MNQNSNILTEQVKHRKKDNQFLELSSKEEKIANLLKDKDQSEEVFDSASASISKTTLKLLPPSDLISKLKEFLPRIAFENEKLANEDPQSIDIEHIEEDAEQVIEWELGLGVFEEQGFQDEDIIMDVNSPRLSQPKPLITFIANEDKFQDKKYPLPNACVHCASASISKPRILESNVWDQDFSEASLCDTNISVALDDSMLIKSVNFSLSEEISDSPISNYSQSTKISDQNSHQATFKSKDKSESPIRARECVKSKLISTQKLHSRKRLISRKKK